MVYDGGCSVAAFAGGVGGAANFNGGLFGVIGAAKLVGGHFGGGGAGDLSIIGFTGCVGSIGYHSSSISFGGGCCGNCGLN